MLFTSVSEGWTDRMAFYQWRCLTTRAKNSIFDSLMDTNLCIAESYYVQIF